MIQFADSGNVYIQFNPNVNLVPVIVVGPTMQTLKFLTLTPPHLLVPKDLARRQCVAEFRRSPI